MAFLSPEHRWVSKRRTARGTERPLLWWLLLLVAVSEGPGEASAPRDIDVKAVYLLRFAEYVDWPPESFATPQSPLVIGVLGDRAMRQALDATTEGEEVRGRRFVVRALPRIEDAKNCHIVFIGKGEADSLEELVASLRGLPVLTVSDVEGFTNRGGMIRFVNEGGKIRLWINLDASRHGRLTVSSRLLRVAQLVQEGRRQ